MSDLVQRTLFSDLVDVTDTFRPAWLPEVDLPGPDWHLGTDEFPVLADPALKGGTDEQH